MSRATVRKVVRGQETEFKHERSVQPAPIRDLNVWKKAVDAIEYPVHRAACMFALLTGLRRSEIENLT